MKRQINEGSSDISTDSDSDKSDSSSVQSIASGGKLSEAIEKIKKQEAEARLVVDQVNIQKYSICFMIASLGRSKA